MAKKRSTRPRRPRNETTSKRVSEDASDLLELRRLHPRGRFMFVRDFDQATGECMYAIVTRQVLAVAGSALTQKTKAKRKARK